MIKMKTICSIFLVLSLCLPGTCLAQSAQDYEALKADYEQLKQKNANLEKDRDNLLSQAKYLLKYK